MSERQLSDRQLVFWSDMYGFSGRSAVAEFRKYNPDPDLWFARQVAARFPPANHRRVADVAGGRGHTSRALKKVGYQVVVTFDPKGKRTGGVALRKRPYLVRDARDFDLVVGFWACEASQKVVRSGKYRPVALLPCLCRHVWPPLVRDKGKLFPDSYAGATKFFHMCSVRFDRVGPLFLSKPSEAA